MPGSYQRYMIVVSMEIGCFAGFGPSTGRSGCVLGADCCQCLEHARLGFTFACRVYCRFDSLDVLGDGPNSHPLSQE
jgi:hypothetical protein